MKKSLLFLALALSLAACGGREMKAVEAPVEDVNAPGGQGGYGNAAPRIPFTGDACEYAKLAFVDAYNLYQEHLGDPLLHERQNQARLAVEAMCGKDKDDEPKTWACAEGHSCR